MNFVRITNREAAVIRNSLIRGGHFELAERFAPIYRTVIKRLFGLNEIHHANVIPFDEADAERTHTASQTICKIDAMDGARVEFFDQDCNFIGFILVVLDAGLEETIANLSSVGVVSEVYDEAVVAYDSIDYEQMVVTPVYRHLEKFAETLQGVPPSDDNGLTWQNWRDLRQASGKVERIRIYRNLTGASLRDAKEWVENNFQEQTTPSAKRGEGDYSGANERTETADKSTESQLEELVDYARDHIAPNTTAPWIRWEAPDDGWTNPPVHRDSIIQVELQSSSPGADPTQIVGMAGNFNWGRANGLATIARYRVMIAVS